MAGFFKFEKKFGYSELFSLIAIIVSALAVLFGYLARQDARIISGFDLEPHIKVNASINKNKFKIFYILIHNSGPVDALQLEASLITHRYFEKEKQIRVSGAGSDSSFAIPKLEPLKSAAFEVSEHFLYVNAMIQKPKEHNVLELRVTYRRPPDFALFSESAFYFVNPDGLWVPESSNSLKPDVYNMIKKAAYNMLNRDIPREIEWDRLYPVKVSELQRH
jgi:hypothetical protein